MAQKIITVTWHHLPTQGLVTDARAPANVGDTIADTDTGKLYRVRAVTMINGDTKLLILELVGGPYGKEEPDGRQVETRIQGQRTDIDIGHGHAVDFRQMERPNCPHCSEG